MTTYLWSGQDRNGKRVFADAWATKLPQRIIFCRVGTSCGLLASTNCFAGVRQASHLEPDRLRGDSVSSVISAVNPEVASI
jgi:hypothetical protein